MIKRTRAYIALILLILSLTLFVGSAFAATGVSLTDCTVDNVNLKGSSTQHDISPSTKVNCSATNMVHDINQYIYMNDISVNPAQTDVNTNINVNYVFRGAGVIVENNNAKNTLVMDFGRDANIINEHLISYPTSGMKTIEISGETFKTVSTKVSAGDSITVPVYDRTTMIADSAIFKKSSDEFLVTATVYGFNVGSTYKLQYSSNNGQTWNDISGTSGIISSSTEEHLSESLTFTQIGDYLIRFAVSQGGSYYYGETAQMMVYNLNIQTDIHSQLLQSGTPVSISVNCNHEGFNNIESYRWKYSLDETTWYDVSGGSLSGITFSHTFYNVGGIYFKLIVEDAVLGTIESNVDGCVVYTDAIITSSGIGSSSSDAYTIAVKTVVPFDILNIYSISSAYGLIVTNHAAYIIDSTLVDWSEQSVIAEYYYGEGVITDCKYQNGHLILKTANGNVFIQNVLTSSFGNTFELTGFDNADVIDCSQFKFMVSDENHGVFLYNYDGSLEKTIYDSENNVWGLTKHSTDESQSTGIIGGKLSVSGQNSIVGYTNYNYDSTQINLDGSGVTYINGLSDQTDKLIVVTNVNTGFVSYRLDSSGFEFTDVNYINSVLASPDASYRGNLISGGNSNSVLIINSALSILANFPTSSTITTTKVAKDTEDLVVCGGANGQVYALANSASGWSGLQSFNIKNSVNSLAVSDDGGIILAGNNNEVYACVKSGEEQQGEIITTLYYLTVTVYDENGLAMPNAEFKVTSQKGSVTYRTDSQGTRTVQVIPTYDYTFSLPNGEDYVTLNANNYALQYVSLSYPRVNIFDGVTYSASLEDNRNISINFNDDNSRLFNLSVEIKDESKVLKYSYYGETDAFSHVFDTEIQSPDSKYFYVSLIATYDGKELRHSWIFEIQTYDDGAGGTTRDPRVGKGVILGDIPFLPSELGENWTTFLFGGLIMLIGGLFSYAHSAKGCVLMVIIAAVLTFVFHVLPINPVWMGCMVILGFLAIYSWASQNEGN